MPQAARIERPSRRLVLAIATHAPLGWLAMATMAAGRLAGPVTFIENGKPVTTLDAGKDAWVVPDPPEGSTASE